MREKESKRGCACACVCEVCACACVCACVCVCVCTNVCCVLGLGARERRREKEGEGGRVCVHVWCQLGDRQQAQINATHAMPSPLRLCVHGRAFLPLLTPPLPSQPPTLTSPLPEKNSDEKRYSDEDESIRSFETLRNIASSGNFNPCDSATCGTIALRSSWARMLARAPNT